MTDDQLLTRWNDVSSRYKELAKSLLPQLQKLNNLEQELISLSEEVGSRGLKVDETKQGGGSTEST